MLPYVVAIVGKNLSPFYYLCYSNTQSLNGEWGPNVLGAVYIYGYRYKDIPCSNLNRKNTDRVRERKHHYFPALEMKN